MSTEGAYESLAEGLGFPGSARLRRVLEEMKVVQPPEFIPGAVA